MLRLLNRWSAMGAFVIALWGCRALGPPIEEPEVFLLSITPLESTLFEHRVETAFRVRNPNDVDLDLRGLDLEVRVNGTRLARVLSGEGATVPRFGETTIKAVASTTTGDLLRQAAALGRTEQPFYEISGYVYLGSSFGRRRMKLERTGNLVAE
jgi:LEA14-like dessication related protein